MRKKTALAAAVLHAPRVLFLDEPFEGIDAISGRAIRNVLQQLRGHGITIFFSSHILEVVERSIDYRRRLLSLLLTPTSRRQILLAKSIAMGSISILPILAIGLVFLAFTMSVLTFAGMVAAVCAGLVSLSVTGLFSVIFPYPVALENTGKRGGFSGEVITVVYALLLFWLSMGSWLLLQREAEIIEATRSPDE